MNFPTGPTNCLILAKSPAVQNKYIEHNLANWGSTIAYHRGGGSIPVHKKIFSKFVKFIKNMFCIILEAFRPVECTIALGNIGPVECLVILEKRDLGKVL